VPPISFEEAHGRPAVKAWPEPHPAMVARRVDEAYGEVAAATPLVGTTGQVGGCGHCSACDVQAPERCHNPDSAAGRRYSADQARADDRDAYHRARVAVELGLIELPAP
jgi:threonine dehydrogenase-like Zn-dependent dehydrogenase